MASNRAESFGRDSSLVGLEADIRPGEIRSIRARNVTLSGTVLVDYDVTVTNSDGRPLQALVRVVFPDEVRSMLESSTWTSGLTIFDAISQLGSSYLERHGVSDAGLQVDRSASGNLRLPTYHVPLGYVRTTLSRYCALPA